MSSRVLGIILYMSMVLVLAACSQTDEEGLLRSQFYEAVKKRDVADAMVKFADLYSRFPVTDEEIFEAAWLAFFCVQDVDLAMTYFTEIDDPKNLFDDAFQNVSVMHLGAWVVCTSKGENECMNYTDDVLNLAAEDPDAYLSMYVEDMTYLQELSRLHRLSEAMDSSKYLSVCLM